MSKHKLVSFLKSGIRLIACGVGVFYIAAGFILLGVAELVGILEEHYEHE